MHILLIEDEDNIRLPLQLNLEMEGYRVSALSHGARALSLLQEHGDIALILLDVMLPDVSGLDICAQIRAADIRTPIIFLTAKDSPADRISGLRQGGDDYLAKPFHLEELLLRIANLLRRSQNTASSATTAAERGDSIQFGGHTVNFRTYEVRTRSGQEFVLTKTEALLLRLLASRAGEVVSRQDILHEVWGYEDAYPSTRTIDNFILSFRKYFEDNPKNPRFFHAIRGVGYKFEQ